MDEEGLESGSPRSSPPPPPPPKPLIKTISFGQFPSDEERQDLERAYHYSSLRVVSDPQCGGGGGGGGCGGGGDESDFASCSNDEDEDDDACIAVASMALHPSNISSTRCISGRSSSSHSSSNSSSAVAFATEATKATRTKMKTMTMITNTEENHFSRERRRPPSKPDRRKRRYQQQSQYLESPWAGTLHATSTSTTTTTTTRAGGMGTTVPPPLPLTSLCRPTSSSIRYRSWSEEPATTKTTTMMTAASSIPLMRNQRSSFRRSLESVVDDDNEPDADAANLGTMPHDIGAAASSERIGARQYRRRRLSRWFVRLVLLLAVVGSLGITTNVVSRASTRKRIVTGREVPSSTLSREEVTFPWHRSASVAIQKLHSDPDLVFSPQMGTSSSPPKRSRAPTKLRPQLSMARTSKRPALVFVDDANADANAEADASTSYRYASHRTTYFAKKFVLPPPTADDSTAATSDDYFHFEPPSYKTLREHHWWAYLLIAWLVLETCYYEWCRRHPGLPPAPMARSLSHTHGIATAAASRRTSRRRLSSSRR